LICPRQLKQPLKALHLIAMVAGIGFEVVPWIACIYTLHIAVAIGRSRILAAWLRNRLLSVIGIRSSPSGLILAALACAALACSALRDGRTLSFDARNPSNESNSQDPQGFPHFTSAVTPQSCRNYFEPKEEGKLYEVMNFRNNAFWRAEEEGNVGDAWTFFGCVRVVAAAAGCHSVRGASREAVRRRHGIFAGMSV